MLPILNKHFMLRLTAIVLLATLAFAAYSLPEDRKEKMHITANITTYDYKKGISYFEGHVIVDQGTTHLTADRLTTRSNNKHRMEEVIAYGVNELAHFWTTPKTGEAIINAHGKIIKFYPLTQNTTLQGDVQLTQGENNFHGQLIHYNMNDQTIIVPETKNGRAVLVYNPD